MSKVSIFEEKLSGGHPNSLGNTEEVVAEILEDTSKLEELYKCYFSDDAVVRLRVSSSWKRIALHDINLFLPYIDRFLDEISKINQASTQWTMALLMEYSYTYLTVEQLNSAKSVLKQNLKDSTDWIVLKNTMSTLAEWSHDDEQLKVWLLPELERLSEFPNKVVPNTAKKFHRELSST